MQTRVCFIYPWATFGGVERVLLNRALAFKHYLPEIRVDFYFLHDSGGLAPLAAAMTQYELNANSSVSIMSSFDQDYDLAFIIDCPQAIDLCVRRSQRYVVECHTSYAENRGYLANLPSTCERLITPSSVFSDLIRNEFPALPAPVGELRNFVPWDLPSQGSSLDNCLPRWTKKPILFFGRLDHLKDPLSLLDAFQLLEHRRKGEFMLLFCGPTSPEIDLNKEISKRSLEGLSVVLPPVAFASAGRLLNSVAHAGGIFVSPSKGESFGLSAAEAISSLVPVVLSDIKAHVNLVSGYEQIFTYPLGDTKKLSARIESVFDDYANACDAVARARLTFSAASFIEDWKHLFNELDIA
ncbi:glycosyltransferase family 4 protein [Pseudomonas sp. LAM2023]|uniref:glycosyltransferase family 4 protein n=1 Tax=Pseudomonas sp. LAM2023 TaxID=2800477 RepID=UPI00190C68C3|nr:glycosyltransferase family 4 protein [Pseudomonas sp. LAM2023]